MGLDTIWYKGINLGILYITIHNISICIDATAWSCSVLNKALYSRLCMHEEAFGWSQGDGYTFTLLDAFGTSHLQSFLLSIIA